ncbi:MAG: hypothetical protein IJC68_04140, partial [Firmicutes bacterium]|nr:hypothetical protein [Bacillota bacterium]
MTNREHTRRLLAEHCLIYPNLQIRDIFKYLFQSAFGCEHMVTAAPEDLADYIRREYEASASADIGTAHESAVQEVLTPLAGKYSRVHLSWLGRGLSPETLGKLFAASAVKEEEGLAALEASLQIAKEMIACGQLPFASEAFEAACADWKKAGYPAVHHSDAFRETYHPAYRVVSNRFVKFLPLLAAVDSKLQQGPLTLAIEGGSASGKTTLSQLLQDLYGCTVFHMDDFFLQPHQRTPQRFAEPGGNVDRERFLEEILLPLHRKEPVTFRPFDCSTMTLSGPVSMEATPLTVIEGAYSMHPELAPYYDFSVFLDITPDLQKSRIGKRNTPDMAQRFFTQWIPLEQTYFSKLEVKERCDLVI